MPAVNQTRIERLGRSASTELARALERLIPLQQREGELPGPRYFAELLASPSTYVFLAWHLHAPVGYLTAYRFPRLDRMTYVEYEFALAKP
jgi:hypothetical protein